MCISCSHVSTEVSQAQAFHSANCTGCTDVTSETCSCTASSGYWSSTTIASSPGFAWDVGFGNGGANGGGVKTGGQRVRAVRGGL
jgi:hypothetical protein